MQRSLYLHFGPHKTGTTSIQSYLDQHAPVLAENGIAVFRDIELTEGQLVGQTRRTNCFQLAHMLLRPELDTIMRLRQGGPRPDPDTAMRLAGAVNRLLHAYPEKAVVVSAETFSFMRTAPERAALERMTDGLALRPVGFFRDKHRWMQSWRGEVARSNLPDRPPAADPANSTFDFSDRSWLLDHDAIRRFFGPEGQYLSYEDAVERHGSVLPDFLALLGLDPATMPDAGDTWRNRTPATGAQ